MQFVKARSAGHRSVGSLVVFLLTLGAFGLFLTALDQERDRLTVWWGAVLIVLLLLTASWMWWHRSDPGEPLLVPADRGFFVVVGLGLVVASSQALIEGRVAVAATCSSTLAALAVLFGVLSISRRSRVEIGGSR